MVASPLKTGCRRRFAWQRASAGAHERRQARASRGVEGGDNVIVAGAEDLMVARRRASTVSNNTDQTILPVASYELSLFHLEYSTANLH